MTDEERQELSKRYHEMLLQNNDQDYADAVTTVKNKLSYEVTDDTPITYATGWCTGLDGNGFVLVGIVGDNKVEKAIIIMRGARAQTKEGPVHLDADIVSLNREGSIIRKDKGEIVLEKTTLGDKKTFCKYVNAIMDYTDCRGYLIRDPMGLVEKKDVQ